MTENPLAGRAPDRSSTSADLVYQCENCGDTFAVPPECAANGPVLCGCQLGGALTRPAQSSASAGLWQEASHHARTQAYLRLRERGVPSGLAHMYAGVMEAAGQAGQQLLAACEAAAASLGSVLPQLQARYEAVAREAPQEAASRPAPASWYGPPPDLGELTPQVLLTDARWLLVRAGAGRAVFRWTGEQPALWHASPSLGWYEVRHDRGMEVEVCTAALAPVVTAVGELTEDQVTALLGMLSAADPGCTLPEALSYSEQGVAELAGEQYQVLPQAFLDFTQRGQVALPSVAAWSAMEQRMRAELGLMDDLGRGEVFAAMARIPDSCPPPRALPATEPPAEGAMDPGSMRVDPEDYENPERIFL